MRALLVALVALAVGAPAAHAHATLQSSSPQRGATLEASPRAVELAFDEPVEGSFGAIRVFDAQARRVDDGTVTHGGAGKRVAVGVKPDLPDGSYTATYRVVSADGHPISGGLLFSVGEPGAAPSATVSELLGSTKAGPATGIAFAAVKAVGYLAIALALGGLLFVAAVWGPAARQAAVADAPRAAFARRAQTMLGVAAVLGVTSTAAGIVLEGATAAGTSFLGALDASVISGVVDTRFGGMWALRLGIWLLLGVGLVGLALSRVTVPALAPQVAVAGAGGGGGGGAGAPGGGSPRPAGRPSVAATVALAAAGVGLALTPALSGHARSQSPAALLVPADVIHVVAMSAWLGGLAFLLGAVPAATRALAPAERTRVLAAALTRFSPLALVSVLALAVTGTILAIVEVGTLSALTGSAFGRAVLIKAILLLVLIAVAAVNRRRVLPALTRLASGGAAPGDTGRLLRRTLRAEVGLIVAVLAVTGALTGYPPPSAEATGPVSVSRTMGPIDMQLTVDPARTGVNEIHLYLFRGSSGAPFLATKELRVSAGLPGRDIGPLDLDPRQAGPGHYVVPAATLSPGGEWELSVTDRVSDFDEHATTVKIDVK